jgi:predicted ester cyclase
VKKEDITVSLEENKALVRKSFEESDRRKTYPAELCAPGFTAHMPGSPPMGLEAWQKYVATYYIAFPDLKVTIEQMVAEGDRVAVRVVARGTHTGELMGIPAGGKQVLVVNHAFGRIAGGRIAEWWAAPDRMGMMQQIGAMPAPGKVKQ